MGLADAQHSHFSTGGIIRGCALLLQEHVIKGFGDKVPKAAAAALDIVTLALR